MHLCLRRWLKRWFGNIFSWSFSQDDIDDGLPNLHWRTPKS